MARYDHEINGQAAWVNTEAIARMREDKSGYEEVGFIASFGFEGDVGNYIQHGRPHLIFSTEPAAAAAGLAELNKLFAKKLL